VSSQLPTFLLLIAALLLGCLPGLAQEKVTAVRIIGLQGLTGEEILSELEGRLSFITSRPPTRSRADDCDFLVVRYLEKRGYADVDLKWRIPSDRRSIELTVRNGPRFTIGEITVLGVEGEQEVETIKKYFTGTALFGEADDTPYIKTEVEKAAGNAATYLKSLGYWKAKAKLHEPHIDRANGKVNLTIETTPGELAYITDIKLEGPIPPETPNLERTLKKRFLEKTATAKRLRTLQTGTAALMREKGYQFAEASLSAEHDGPLTYFTLILNPGKQYRSILR